MSKSITVKEGATAKNFTGVKKISTNQMGGGSVSWIPEDEAADYCTFKKITARENGTYKAEDNACDGFSEVTVEIPLDVKDKVITTNGEYLAAEDNCVGYRKVTVNVSGGGSGSGQHTVFFYAADRETILEKVTVDDGGGAIYHGIQPWSSGMRFVGWNPNPRSVKADMNCYPRFENVIYDPTQIVDDWATIAKNCQTNPDKYHIGQWKLLELNPDSLTMADRNQNTIDGLTNWSNADSTDKINGHIKMMLVAKGVDELEGENGYANTTWLALYPAPFFDYIWESRAVKTMIYPKMKLGNDFTHPNSWIENPYRAFLMDQFTSVMFPHDILKYMKRVIKHTATFDKVVGGEFNRNTVSIDWFFVPSAREIFGHCQDYTSYGDIEQLGAVYFDHASVAEVSAYWSNAFAQTCAEYSTDSNPMVMLRTYASNAQAAYPNNNYTLSYDKANNTTSIYRIDDRNSAFTLLGFCL